MRHASCVTTRLAAHRLVGRRFTSAPDVVRAFGAVQAQDFAGALWALAQRVDAPVTHADLADAFDRGEIIRTHVLRPTWHFVAPEDLRGLLALTGPRVQAACASRYAAYGIDATLRTRAADVIARAIEDAGPVTRAMLAEALRRAGIAADTYRLESLLINAELEGVICSGPRSGAQFTYALVDRRVPRGPAAEREATLAALIGRYFAFRGPATVADAAWWSGLTQREVREGIALAGDRLERVVADGIERWQGASPPTDADVPRRRCPLVHLLPSYDEYTVAYRDRAAILHPSTPVSGPAQSALLLQPVLVNGRHAGGWRRATRSRTADTVRVEVHLIDPPTPSVRKALESTAAAYSRFLQRPVVVNAQALHESHPVD